MKPTRLIVCVLVVACCPSVTESKPKKSEGGRDAKFDALIDALANRVNTAPKIDYDFSWLGDHGIPLFDEEYDVAEQIRVKGVLRGLNNLSDRNRLWPRLVAHFDDERYAFTFYDRKGCTGNITVSQLCRTIVFDDLEWAFQQHSPRNPKAPGPSWLVRGPHRTYEEFRNWLDERKEKLLYELQIELCEWSIETPKALERLSADQLQEFTQKVKKQIETLIETGQPVIDKERFNNGFYGVYSEERLKELRDVYDHPERRRLRSGPPMPPVGNQKSIGKASPDPAKQK